MTVNNRAENGKGETPERVKPALAVRRAKPFRHNAFRSGAPNNRKEEVRTREEIEQKMRELHKLYKTTKFTEIKICCEREIHALAWVLKVYEEY